MSGCSEFRSSMTGSTNSGPLQPQEDSSPHSAQALPFERVSASDSLSMEDYHGSRPQSRRKTMPTPPTGQQIQLTPLWEHVVRTHRFPPEIDTYSTFIEISERLRDPEWEVRQHALRVLMDVLPTLSDDVVDKVMQPVVPELINNLGHPAPAVRKGALDTLRVYLVHSRNRDDIVKNILQEGLNRPGAHDTFQTNVTTGVILSAPSLLFPSSSSPPPGTDILKDATIALATRLAQVPHQEAALKSLIKIRDSVGVEKFESYLKEHDNKLKRNIEVLSKIYNIKSVKKLRKSSSEERQDGDLEKDFVLDRSWDSDSDTSGIVEEEEDANGAMPAARVVLETEIKFNEETAITMTILEEKDDDSEDQDEESGTDLRNEETSDVLEGRDDRKKTPRRVHFGGEVVKLRTPDSDDTEVIETPKTRIPLPISPATKLPPEKIIRRPSSQPCSPHLMKKKPKRKSRSIAGSPKREIYMHSADLSPKKSILSRPSSPVLVSKYEEQVVVKSRRSLSIQGKDLKDILNAEKKDGDINRTKNSDSLMNLGLLRTCAQEIHELVKKEDVTLVQSSQINELSANISSRHDVRDQSLPLEININNEIDSKDDNKNSESASSTTRQNNQEKDKEDRIAPSKKNGSKESERDSIAKIESKSSSKSHRSPTRGKTKAPAFEVFPRQERNYILMELSSPERKALKEKEHPFGMQTYPESQEENTSKNNEEETKSADESLQDPPKLENIIESNHRSLQIESKASKSIDKQEYIVEPVSIDTKIDDRLQENSRLPKLIPAGSGNQQGNDLGSANRTSKKTEADSATIKDRLVDNKSVDNARSAKASGSERKLRRTKRERESEATNGNGSVTCSSSEGETNPQEPSWEELGLVDHEVLDDLHNKEDWRARVRALERVASALRTSSALIAIEPRLGSLLHAVLGGERSCRVAAAGLGVAKVVVAGVTEDALKRRLPQLAWGLARQGGPNAAQLARIAMLRLRPALLLEQLLQPQCLGARNAKTRENALQLLIFSLVTFPSTEFKVDAVAQKVAAMVADRRRRVRQAALDTLAVLAQIYESEEVLQAGKRAAAGRHDREAMVSAIRARLARKSLPLVSADGLVVYGLQISPTVQIATGPDVDWIVAGSGSVSPGTGRVRGQIINTAPNSEKARITRSDSTRSRDSPWTERANLVALGVGLHSRGEQPVAWQIVPTVNDDDHPSLDDVQLLDTCNANGKNSSVSMRSGDRSSYFSSESQHETDNEFTSPQENGNAKTDSRIPILCPRDRSTNTKLNRSTRDKYLSTDFPEGSFRKMEKDGSCGTVYQRKKKLQQGRSPSTSTNTLSDQSVDSYSGYRPTASFKASRDCISALERNQGASQINSENSKQRFVSDEKFAKSFDGRANYRVNSIEDRLDSLSKNVQQTLSTSEMYDSLHQRRRVMESQSFRALQTAPVTLTRAYLEYQNLNQQLVYQNDRNLATTKVEHRTRDASAPKITEVEQISTDVQTNSQPISKTRSKSPFRRRLRSLSPTQLHYQRQLSRMSSNELHSASMFNIDKAPANEEEYNERNRQHYSADADEYQRQPFSAGKRFQAEEQSAVLKSAGSSTSNAPRSNREIKSSQSIVGNGQEFTNANSRLSTPQNCNADKAFDVITATQDTVDSYIMSVAVDKQDTSVESTIASIEDDVSKEWSSEEEIKTRTLVSIGRNDSEAIENDENSNVSEDSSTSTDELETVKEVRRSVISIISNEKLFGGEILKSDDSLQSNSLRDVSASASARRSLSPSKSESSCENQIGVEDVKSMESAISICTPRSSPYKTASFAQEDFKAESSERIISSAILDEDASVGLMEVEHARRESIARESPSIIIASRPHSTDPMERTDNTVNIESNLSSYSMENINDINASAEESSVNNTSELESTKDFAFSTMLTNQFGSPVKLVANDNASETNTEPGILKIEPSPLQVIDAARRLPSRVPRSVRYRTTSNKTVAQSTEKVVEKPKVMLQQCFAQLEHKDWEVTLKGLKALSQIAKQHPEHLDSCAGGTIGRLLGRHIKNLRSQVSRAACVASGDIFSSQIRGIDQDLDDIACSLLHRTADTNRFLRADSNAALDLMIEHLPAHKTIGVIVHRGANHQNAIVRAAAARLLSVIVDRVGPEHAMTLPRDAKEKMLNAGAKMLMDGNLDTRNHAKKMFRRLMLCEGFQKALNDSVPESTLRHIDKTLKSL